MSEVLAWAFFGLIALMALATLVHSHSVDPPLENEAYLAENPELRELKDDEDN